MTNDYDAEFEQFGSATEGRSLRWMSLAIMALVVFGFFSLVWYAYDSTTIESTQDTVPVITAEQPDYKVKPDDVGGLPIENKDIAAYDLMRRDPSVEEDVQVIERLMPSADKPIIIETVRPNIGKEDTAQQQEMQAINEAQSSPNMIVTDASQPADTASNENDKLQRLIRASAEAEQRDDEDDMGETNEEENDTSSDVEVETFKPISTKVKETPKPLPEAVMVPEAPVATKTTPVVRQAPPSLVKATAAPSTGAYVQLAALRSEAEAVRLWEKLSAKHKDLLGSYSYYTQPVTISGKGTLYRLRVKGMDSAKAKSLCASLKNRGQSCLAGN